MSDKSLDGPGGTVTQSANRVSLDLLRDLPEHVDFFWPSIAADESGHDLVHPADTLAARRALSTALVFVEGDQSGDGLDDVRRLVHDDDRGCSERGLASDETVKVHDGLGADVLWDDGSGRAARDDAQEIVPSATDATAVALDQLLEGN